ncbi:DUF5666 domain-containing protein [uncultured Roseobacter sp.]|uniref:DUF5666 domain-containing protein n=1 Tax=uncultured Roseobacter sp. TaxID=114847 RepID=UPI0026247CD7|nr:DUF5666 domain-containing protein [uncultured Roseobacter sp.]
MTTGKLSRRFALAAGLSSLMWPQTAWPRPEDREVEGGIGGTGIVGILTEFGSLIVSGNRVETDLRTEFSGPFGPLSESDIRVGDSLTIEALGSAGNLRARRVHVTYPLVGTVSERARGGRQLTVNGVPVLTEAGAPLPSVGDRVAVSGLWRDDEVVASRLSLVSGTLDLVSGDVLRTARGIRIGPVSTRGRGLASRSNGSFASAIGRFDADRGILRATDITTARFTGAAGALARLSIEGYLTRSPTAPGYRIAGLGHSFERNLDLQKYAEARVLFNGAYTGRFAAESAVILPDNVSARQRVLRRLANS